MGIASLGVFLSASFLRESMGRHIVHCSSLASQPYTPNISPLGVLARCLKVHAWSDFSNFQTSSGTEGARTHDGLREDP